MYNLSKVLIDFTSCPKDKPLIELYPKASNFKEFQDSSELEMKIMICLTDFDSPFVLISDPENRLRKIFEFLDIDADKKITFFNDILNWKNENILNMAVIYLQMQSNHDFTRWWTLNRLYYELQQELNKPKRPDEDFDDYLKRKLAIERGSDGFVTKLAQYEQKLFPDLKMKESIVTNEMVKIIGYPEKHSMERQVI